MKLLCERQVLVMMDWPSRMYLNARMKNDGFPSPALRSHGIGDQWREDQILKWLGVETRGHDGTDRLKRRFEAMGTPG